jgi:YidC/Oxa1 family membrane protein insertase
VDAIFGLLEPIEWVVSWIMLKFHSFFTLIGMPSDGGWTWALSIVGLVLVMRILLIPLFVKQIKSQRGLQMLQPELKKLQAKYKNDRERQTQEMMKLYKEAGTNPFSSCLPIIAQSPFFFALFRVLKGVSDDKALGALTQTDVTSAANAKIFGAQISETFMHAESGSAKIVALVLIILMSASTFTTQKQLMSKNMPASAMEGSFAQQQKILLYVFPLIFAVTGINFPIGVLIYWFTTNVWSMGQQFYVIHRMPAPGSLAEANMERRRAERAARKAVKGDVAVGAALTGNGEPGSTSGVAAGAATPPVRRQQPKRQARAKRKPPSPTRPSTRASSESQTGENRRATGENRGNGDDDRSGGTAAAS